MEVLERWDVLASPDLVDPEEIEVPQDLRDLLDQLETGVWQVAEVSPEPQEPPDLREAMVLMEREVPEDLQAALERLAGPDPQDPPENLAQLDFQVWTVRPAPQAHRDPLATTVAPDKWAPQASPDQWALRVPRDLWERGDPVARREFPAPRVLEVPLETWAPPASVDREEPLDLRETKEAQEVLDPQDHLDSREPLDPLESLESLELMESQVSLENPAPLEPPDTPEREADRELVDPQDPKVKTDNQEALDPPALTDQEAVPVRSEVWERSDLSVPWDPQERGDLQDLLERRENQVRTVATDLTVCLDALDLLVNVDLEVPQDPKDQMPLRELPDPKVCSDPKDPQDSPAPVVPPAPREMLDTPDPLELQEAPDRRESLVCPDLRENLATPVLLVNQVLRENREKTVSQDVRAPLETLGYLELLERGDLTVAPDPQDSPAPRETVEPQDLPECRDPREQWERTAAPVVQALMGPQVFLVPLEKRAPVERMVFLV